MTDPAGGDPVRDRLAALVRWLHNEGDGGVWESFDRKNAEEFAAAFLRSTWLADERTAAAREALLGAADDVDDLNSGWDGPGKTQGHERSRFRRWLRDRAAALGADDAR